MSVENLSFDLDAIVNRGKGNRNYKKSETLKQGQSFYRILPSAFPGTRQLSKFWAVHWLTGPNGKKIQAECTYYKEKFCPICNAHKEVEEELKRAKENGNKELIDRLNETEQALRPSRHVYYNALNSSNELVVLKLSSTVSRLLEARFAESVKVKGIDPISMSTGVWFQFTKNGIGRDSVMVDFKRDPKTEQLDRTSLDESFQQKYLGGDATNIYTPEGLNVKQFTSRQLANYLNGQPLELATAGTQASQAEEHDDQEDDVDAPAPAQAPVAATRPTPVQAASAPAPVQAQSAPTLVAPAAAAITDSRKAELDRLRNLMKPKK